MKKILFVALLVIATLSVVLFFPKHSTGTSYPRDTVTTTVSASASTLGVALEEHRALSGNLGSQKILSRAGTWVRELIGREYPADADEFLIRAGATKITITSLYRAGNVHELRIDPSPSASKLSADLKSEILKSLPGLTFKP